jgi:hypothetical protein
LINNLQDIEFFFIRLGDELQDIEIKGDVTYNDFTLALETTMNFNDKSLIE